MAETWTLDGLAVNDGTTFQLREGEIDLTPPKQRPEWIGAADSEFQDLVRNPLHENRVFVLPLQIVPTATKDLAFDKVGQIVTKLALASATRGGIDLTWTAHGSARTVTFEVLAGEISEFNYDRFLSLGNRARLTITLTCKPYGLGTETLTSTTSSSTPFVTAEITGTGDVTNLGRLIVTDTATQSRRHVEWGLEGPLTYNSSTSLILDSDSLVTSGFAGAGAVAGPTGAYDPNAAGNNVILAAMQPQATAVCGTGNQSHVGSFRVKARVYFGNVPADIRFSYRAGDGPMSSNQWSTVSAGTSWLELDLGTITIPTVLAGTQRWTGQIEARATTATNMLVDYIVLVPVSDGYGKARAAYSYQQGVLTGFDDFTGTTAAAALNARVAPAGGTWATSGAATDFAFADDLSGEQIKRSTISDASPRFAILGTATPSDTEASVAFREDGTVATFQAVLQGVIARWTDSSNYLLGYVSRSPLSGAASLLIESYVAGVRADLASVTVTGAAARATMYRLRLIAFSSGRVILMLLNQSGATVIASTEASASSLATGGALATGKVGIYDRSSNPTVIARHYDDFQVATPPAEPIVIYSGRNMQIRHDDTIRQDLTGVYTGRPQSYRGSRFLVPVGTSRVLVKARRNDIDATADANVTDATQIQIGVTPRYLAVPR